MNVLIESDVGACVGLWFYYYYNDFWFYGTCVNPHVSYLPEPDDFFSFFKSLFYLSMYTILLENYFSFSKYKLWHKEDYKKVIFIISKNQLLLYTKF